jgi:hypothetical protein
MSTVYMYSILRKFILAQICLARSYTVTDELSNELTIFLSKFSFVVYQSSLYFGPHILAIMIVFANKTVLFQNNVRLHLLIRSAVIEIGHWYCLECKFTVVNHSKPPVHIIYIIYK